MKHMFGLRTSRQEADRRAAWVGSLAGSLSGSQPGLGKQPVVGRGVLPATLVPVRDVSELHAQHRCLNGVHASVPAEFVMVVAPGTAMVAELPHVLGYLRTVRGDDASVSVSAEVLGGIETEGGGYAERARAASAPLGANRLGGVLDDCHFELLGIFMNYAVESVHIGALPVKMHGKNRANISGLGWSGLPVAESPANQRRIQIQGAGINVHEDRRCARPHNCAGRGKEAECGGDHRVPGLYTGGDERQPERLRSRRTADGAGCSRQGGNLSLERFNLRTEDEALRIAYASDGGQHLGAEAIVLAAQVQERNSERNSERNGLGRGVCWRLAGK